MDIITPEGIPPNGYFCIGNPEGKARGIDIARNITNPFEALAFTLEIAYPNSLCKKTDYR